MKKLLKHPMLPLVIGLACISNQTTAAEYVLDTGSGIVFKDGVRVDNINGVKVSSILIDSGKILQLKVAGNLNLGATDSLIGEGGRGASIVVANNANIHSNAVIDFSSGKGGGGVGGIGGAGGAGGEGGAGGAGGREFKFVYLGTDNVLEGRGGAGNTPICIIYCTANSGEHGSRGESGSFGGLGGAGLAGQDGQNGGVGLNDHHLAAGQGGDNSEYSYTAGGQGGDYGFGGLYGFGGNTSSNGKDGYNGYSGQIGDKGATGRSGLNGTGGQNWATGFTISGGSAGGGAAGGYGGGGAGGSGGSGAGGGGGGGGGEIGSVGRPIRGGDGGAGGAGANGATGGDGGDGQSGGRGGHGGGALEIIVMGELNAAGHFSAEGGDGQTAVGNRAGSIGGSASSGSRGDYGEQRQSDGAGSPTYSGAGGDGGNGGNALRGAQGGTGGLGGTGGGGAGGTVKLVASVINAVGATVDTSGGNQGEANEGGYGRFITGSNATAGGPSLLGAITTSMPTGTVGENPYNKLPSGLIPYIPNLVGGAETFGLLDGINAQHSTFNNYFGSKPDDAIGALLRLDVGPLGYNHDFDGFDMLLFMSLSDNDLANPMLGIDPLGTDPNFLVNLMQGGFANDIGFGGLGDTIMDVLGSFNIFATLIAETDNFFNAKLGDSFLRTSLQNDQIAFLRGTSTDFQDPVDNPDEDPGPTEVPEPSTLVLILFALYFLIFRRKESSW